MRLGCLSHMTLRIKHKVSSVSGSLLRNHPLCPPLTSARDRVHRPWRAAGFAAPDRASSRLPGAAEGQREASAQTSRLNPPLVRTGGSQEGLRQRHHVVNATRYIHHLAWYSHLRWKNNPQEGSQQQHKMEGRRAVSVLLLHIQRGQRVYLCSFFCTWPRISQCATLTRSVSSTPPNPVKMSREDVPIKSADLNWKSQQGAYR